MPTVTPPHPEVKDQGASIDSHLAGNVLVALGRVPDLHDVQVRKVNTNSYRVNVRTTSTTKADTTAMMQVHIAHSYYVHAGEDGRILSSSPPLRRLG